MWEKKPLLLSSLSPFIIKKKIQSCTGTDSYQHRGTHLHKFTSFSHFSAPTGRELQPPALLWIAFQKFSHWIHLIHYIKYVGKVSLKFQTGLTKSNNKTQTNHHMKLVLIIVLTKTQINHKQIKQLDHCKPIHQNNNPHNVH